MALVTNLEDFKDKCKQIKCNFTSTTLETFQKISCECIHKAKILEFEGENLRNWIKLCLFIIVLFLVGFAIYYIGLAKGAYYAATFGTGGCYAYPRMFWDEDCEVIY